MMFELYIDFKCPASYLALQPSIDLAEKVDVALQFKAFESEQLPVPVYKENETRSESHFRVRAEQSQHIHEHYAHIQDLTLNFREIPGETTPALAVLNSWQEDPLPFIREAFHAYWEKGADLGQPETVLTLAAKAGRTLSMEELQEECRRLRESQQAARENAVFITPTYRVAGQLFVGRENLPWVSEILERSD